MNTKRVVELHPDAAFIDHLGGAAEVARRLGYLMPHGVRRVQNWKYRGIPPLLRYQRPDIFGPQPETREEAA